MSVKLLETNPKVSPQQKEGANGKKRRGTVMILAPECDVNFNYRCLAPLGPPSSPPLQAIRSSFSLPPRSLLPPGLGWVAERELFPEAAYHSLSSPMPSRRIWPQRSSFVVLVREAGRRPRPSHHQRIHARCLGNPFLWQPGDGDRELERRWVGAASVPKMIDRQTN